MLVGCRPFKDDKVSEKVKLNIIRLLNEKYGVVEEDFLSAELTAVPQFKARDVGLDRSMVGSYGHDDRVCAYTSLMAELEAENPAYTTVTVFTDKEETGSDGNTGLNSNYLKYFIKDLAGMHGLSGREVLSKSTCLSADVNAAYEPDLRRHAGKTQLRLPQPGRRRDPVHRRARQERHEPGVRRVHGRDPQPASDEREGRLATASSARSIWGGRRQLVAM